jgi:hypothetical protein
VSNQIKIPDEVRSKAVEVLEKSSFDDLLKLFLRGASRHAPIGDQKIFELTPVSAYCIGDKAFTFMFAITHECTDDRSNWVNDEFLEVEKRKED